LAFDLLHISGLDYIIMSGCMLRRWH